MRRVLFLGLLLLAGCDTSRVYEYNIDFDERFWPASEKPKFEFHISDPGKTYNVYYNIRNSIDYPYARIFVQYALSDSLGNELKSELKSAYLFDEVTGKPFGSSGIGDIYDHQFSLLKAYQFPRRGKYVIQLEQFTRQDTLSGILAVGVRVEENIKP
ncbi:MAG: gliding motility lipoprotein GldH [Cyclobacteriaceae bacterium]